MTDKIYEYKDEENWFIGKWNGNNSIRALGHVYDEALYRIEKKLDFLNPSMFDDSSDSINGYSVTVVRKESDAALIDFILDIIRQESDRNIEAKYYKDTIIISEDGIIHDIIIPEQGIALEDFLYFSQEDSAKTILVATRNDGKTKEFRELFKQFGYKVENLKDYPELPEVEETGMTFEENARLKAETISKLTGKMVVADDSGLKVDILGGLPGVWSARFSGPDATDAKNNAKLLHELAMVFDQKKRSAQFHSTLVVAAPNKESLVVEADWPGYIANQPKGDQGFGYDSLFIVGETGRHAAELSPEEKNKLSHRGLAFQKLMEVFPQWQRKQ
ncbi:nucleoside-triphosphate diphosphatase [Streptococcus didelphis]|uniref:nucleoside-triphosphate diphosphatase n=1 Tax=Streptococcus didelphis TaxID=102886 RepID=UPI00037410CD|nr:nucleoside-triphosphate diphosphatase [Streptococcus didelphis]